MELQESGFTSYLDDEKLATICLSDEQKTKFLDGETIVSEVNNVRMYAPLSDRKRFALGVLTVSTFKVSFACPEEDRSFVEKCCQQNYLLGLHDVCLSSIDVIYQLGDRTRKKLVPGQSVSGKIKDLLVVCRNMRTLEFGFTQADKDGGKNIVNAILHHAFPKRHSLLFAYDYREPYYQNSILKEVRLFRHLDDWSKELARTKCKNWRVSAINESYELSLTMMSTLIVPKSINDAALIRAVEHFRNRYCPVWVWGTARGAALVRMSHLLPTIQERTQENLLLESIRGSHPTKEEPFIIDLTRCGPSPKDIQTSFLKLRELCVPESTRVFKSQDYKFYGLLDATKWLGHVSTCLAKAVEASNKLLENKTVVLQEGDGHDLNCVVSSLIQIMLDPFFRTKFGFQTLIQKEWVAMGHPFTYRLGHMLSKDAENEQSPVFLLFLDCVWQLIQQYPTAMQISETYLTSVWDSAHISIFETFLFPCDHDRTIQLQGSRFVARSVWDWKEQYSDKDIGLFCNPLFDDGFREILRPEWRVSHLDVWLQCYFRWLPDLEIRCGGRAQIDLCCRILVKEIWGLQTAKLKGEHANGVNNGSDKREVLDLLQKVNSFFPFSRNNGEMCALFPSNNVFLTGDMFETQSMINFNND